MIRLMPVIRTGELSCQNEINRGEGEGREREASSCPLYRVDGYSQSMTEMDWRRIGWRGQQAVRVESALYSVLCTLHTESKGQEENSGGMESTECTGQAGYRQTTTTITTTTLCTA